MRRHRETGISPEIALDTGISMSLYQQLYTGLKNAILMGQLKAGRRLPSTRMLANDLNISRATVQIAFDQLIAEGYLEGRPDSGTYVTAIVSTEGFLSTMSTVNRAPALSQERTLSHQAHTLLMLPDIERPIYVPGQSWPRAFRVGQPAYDVFPTKIWEQFLLRSWRRMPPDLLAYQHPAGYLPLREAIAEYLATARGVHCTAKQIIIVGGSQQGLDLAARVLLNPGEHVWIEDPGYIGARGAFLAAGAHLVPLPLDAEGIIVDAGKARAPDARLAFVTPSHQFPLGMTVSLTRRLELLEWANTASAWIIEDDYDSEFRYVGRPPAALQGMDTTQRVIYLGTFSKILFPVLRLGDLVVPSDLVHAFVRMQMFALGHVPLLEQMALADFLNEGHFTRHIRRMRQLYHERQRLLLDGTRHTLAGVLDIQQSQAGMHLIGWLPHDRDDRQIALEAARVGVDVSPLSRYCLETHQHPGVLLGYTSVNKEQIDAGLKKLAHICM